MSLNLQRLMMLTGTHKGVTHKNASDYQSNRLLTLTLVH